MTRSWYIAHLTNFLSMCCHMSATLLSLYWKETGFEDWQIGWMAASFSTAAILSRLGLGKGMETWGRRPFMIVGAAMLHFPPLTYPYLGERFELWILARLIQGYGLGIYITAILTWVADISPPEKIGQMQGVFGVSGLLGAAAGPFAFEKVYLNFGFHEMFEWLFATGVACWLLACTLPETRVKEEEKPNSPSAALRIGDHLATVVVSIPFGWVVGTIISFIAPFTKTLHMEKVGLYFSGFAIASVAVRVFAGTLIDKVSINSLVVGSSSMMAGCGLAIGALTYAPSTALLLTAAFLNGIGHGFLFPGLSSYIVKNSTPRQRGAGLALFTASFDGGILAGGLCSGYISQAFGYQTAFLTSAVLMLISLPVFLFLNRK